MATQDEMSNNNGYVQEDNSRSEMTMKKVIRAINQILDEVY